MECKNCYTTLSETAGYCYDCGGKIIRNRLTMRNLFEHISETFFNYDNKLLRTFIALFKKPEVVIGGYIEGVRKRYVNPISFFGIILTINGLNIFIINKFFKKYLDAKTLFNTSENSADLATSKIMDMSTDISLEYASLLFSLLIPIAALISLIVFYKKKYNYTEHVIIYLYSMSVYSILSVIFGLLVLLIIPERYLTFGTLMYIFIFVYHCYILKRLFHLSFRQLVLKTLLFIALFSFTYIGIVVVTFITLLLTGTLNPQDFAPPK